jgi:7,8-dihydropterin-6-yl-methyl-4-(beta-D-ribofuranosyl)aminobenzene 5'-phosphate synthase
MKLTALVENCPVEGFAAAHGLSLYVEYPGRRLLFDLGPDDTLFRNAETLGIDLAQVDTVVISHGHNDHGGALGAFLARNDHATVYIQRRAFERHESHGPAQIRNISLDASLMEHPQVKLLDGDCRIDDRLFLFTVTDPSLCPSTANGNLYENGAPDRFLHEQNLLIEGDKPVLLCGCSHNGVLNILKRVEGCKPAALVGGFHLYSPSAKKTVAPQLMDEIAAHLSRWPQLKLYTGHCTGQEACDYLSARVPGLSYLHCGESLEL